MTLTTKLTRDEMIERLSDSMIDTLRSDFEYARIIVMSGFTGYNNYTDEELVQEYNDYIGE